MATPKQLAVMAKHYVIAAIWADCPEGTNPRATKESERIALERCTRYVELIGPLFDECVSRHDDGYGMHPDCGRDEPACAAMGHDLYLTCAGHGVGFWDRKELDEGGLGDALTAHCKTMGEPDAYFYRGWLYFQ